MVVGRLLSEVEYSLLAAFLGALTIIQRPLTTQVQLLTCDCRRGAEAVVEPIESQNAGFIIVRDHLSCSVNVGDVYAIGGPDRRIVHVADTTKPKGTGLGLATVHRIVEAHGALLRVESRPGQGTVIGIAFPSFEALESPS